MSVKQKGIITSIGSVLVLLLLSMTIGVIVAQFATDSWAALGVMFMMFAIAGVLLIALTIYGLVIYLRKQSKFGEGVLIGMGMVVGFVLFIILFINIYNFFVG